MKALERRVQRLEAERGADEEISLEEAVIWSYRLKDEPFDEETHRQYDEFCRRSERSKLGGIFKDMMASVGSNRSRHAGAAPIAAPAEPAATVHAPVSRAEPVFEEHQPTISSRRFQG
jgi:hypothetical protein